MKEITTSLEQKARVIAKVMQKDIWEPSPRGTIAREITLVLEELEKARHLHKDLDMSLLKAECFVDTELMKQEGPERLRLKFQLINLDGERRRMAVTKSEQLRNIHYRLLDLLNKHSHLTFDDD